MRLTVLGSSGGTPSRTNPSSGYLIEAGATTIWVDCGTGTFMPLARLTDPGRLSAVVVSHIHVDHCTDLFGLYGYLAYGPSGIVPIPVYVPEGAAAHLAAFARAADEHVFHHVLDLITVRGGDTATVGDVTVSFGDADHSVPCLVSRFEHGGSSLVYSGDTGPGGDLAASCTDADVALVEASLQGARGSGHIPHHLTAFEAGEVAAAGRVGRLIVTHVPPTLDTAVTVREAAAGFGRPVVIAEPGATHEVRRQ